MVFLHHLCHQVGLDFVSEEEVGPQAVGSNADNYNHGWMHDARPL